MLGAGSSAGRASALQAEGHRFKPCSAYHLKCYSLALRGKDYHEDTTIQNHETQEYHVISFGGVVQFG